MWSPRVIPDLSPLPAPVQGALDAGDLAGLVAQVGPDAARLDELVQRLAFYGRAAEAVAIVNAAHAVGYLTDRQTSGLAGDALLQSGDLGGALQNFRRYGGLRDTWELCDLAMDVWAEGHHGEAIRCATLAVRHALASSDDEMLAEAVEFRRRVAVRLGVLTPDGEVVGGVHCPPVDVLDHRAVARLLAQSSEQPGPEDVLAAEHLCSMVDYGMLGGRPFAAAYFPAAQWPAAASQWPDLTAHAETWEEHCGEVDVALTAAVGSLLRHAFVVPVTVAGLVAAATRQSWPVDARWARDLYAYQLLLEGYGTFWPPERDAPCWCGESAAYGDCCADRVPPALRAAAVRGYVHDVS